jgi:toxin FitB
MERLARRDLAQAEIFEQWLSRLVHAYGDRIVPITVRVAEAWGVSMSLTRCPWLMA